MRDDGRRLWIKRSIWSLALVLTFSALANLLFVPPKLEPSIKAPRPVIKKIPDAENAWVEYRLALTKFKNHTPNPFTKPAWVVSNEAHKLTDEEHAYLTKYQDALPHLLAGVKRPKAQRSGILADFQTPPPNNIIEQYDLVNLVGQQVNSYQLDNELDKATELNLAIYRFASDQAEEFDTFREMFTSFSLKNAASGDLFKLLLNDKLDADSSISIARQLADLDKRITSPAGIIEWGWQADLRYYEDWLMLDKVKDKVHGIDIKYWPQALRTRFYKSIVAHRNRLMDKDRAILKNWDIAGIKKFHAENIAEINLIYPAEIIALDDEIDSDYPGIMSIFYRDRSNSAVLQAFAVLHAYQKRHGQFPADLAQAFDEAGLSVPIDPITKRAIQYRLDNGTPLIWLAGMDGKDDGGQLPYTRKDYSQGSPGKDLIFKFGEMPFNYVYTDPKNQPTPQKLPKPSMPAK